MLLSPVISTEVSLDAISQVTAVPTEFTQIETPGADFDKTEFYAKGTRAMQLYDSAVVSRFLRAFGRNQRVITCQCERSSDSNLSQALQMINGPLVHAKVRDDKNRLRALAAAGKSDEEIVGELYLAALCRKPTIISQAMGYAGWQGEYVYWEPRPENIPSLMRAWQEQGWFDRAALARIVEGHVSQSKQIAA
jgi:hypothetical protein